MGFARNVHFTIKDGQVDEFNRVFTTEIAPMFKSEKGLVSQTLMFHDRKGVGFTLWNDKAAAEAYNLKTYPEVLKRLTPMLEGLPRVDIYDRVVTMPRA